MTKISTHAALQARVEELERKLGESEQTVRSLVSGEIDAIVHQASSTPLLLLAAQTQLLKNEQLFRAVFDGAMDALLIADDSGCYVDVNPAACLLFGLPRERLLGRTNVEFGDSTFGRAGAWTQFLRNGRSEGQFRMQRSDGSERDIDFRATSRILPELHLSVLRIGSLAGGVAHDFNNLLSVILSYTSLIVEDLKPTDPLRGDIEEVRKAGMRATELTAQLLTFSRHQMLQPVVLDLNTIVSNIEKMLGRLLREDIQLSLLPAPLAVRVYADAGQLEQVITNLVVNARDAMPNGGNLIIETALVMLDERYTAERAGVLAGAYVSVAVTDTGIGMDAPTQERIFEPFFTTKGLDKGTGLGLSTVYGIVQQSGGHIHVDSKLGKGTTFTIYLPWTDRNLSSDVPVAIALSTLRGTETILLVEDEEQVLTVMRAILRKHGYNVLDARNGGEAFLICEQYAGGIDLLLTDVVMPRMSGRQLAERLLTLRPALKVLYVSGYMDDATVHHGSAAGGVAFLQKPVLPATLLEKIRQLLDTSSPQSIAPAA